MKTGAIQRLRKKLSADEAVYGLWITLESASISEMAVALGLDWIVIDAEHGHLDWKDILEHIRATVRSETVALVRIAELNVGLIKRALDIGADGVVVPWIETAEQLDRAIAFARYPPEGSRGIGAERATGWGQCVIQHTQEANEHVLVIPIIETVTAGRNIQQISQCIGSELFFFGPADYSSTAGFRGQWEGPGVAAQLQKIKNTLVERGKHCGVIATTHDNLIARRREGFRMLGLGVDSGMLLRSLHATLDAVGQDRRILPTLVPDLTMPLPRPPEPLRPDRIEMITAPGTAPQFELAAGIAFDCQVGNHNGARDLTTGLVTFEPSAQLPYHTHPFTESVTVLEGALHFAVEGREYLLTSLDNVVVPRGFAHTAWNAAASSRTKVHVALATNKPVRDLVSTSFARRVMPNDSTGVPLKERVTRFSLATRCGDVGPGASFIDFCNKDLVPGIEMSGGYALFQPGGRLPAHVHDFDESICIVQGTATCVVEGRRYSMADCATALQPRGRVHYFINEGQDPMAMIWYYAGPTPKRIVVNEHCATAEGDPWRA